MLHKVSKQEEDDVMTDKTRLLCDILLQLSGQTEVAKVLPQSEGIKHGKESLII